MGFAAAAAATPSQPAATPRGAPAFQAPSGRELAESLGCGACHAGLPGRDAIRRAAPPLGSNAVPLAPAYVFRYMADPRSVRPEIAPARMPAYELDERQRLALALFSTNEIELRGVDDAFRSAQSRHRDASREEGRLLFASLACGGCHEHPEAPEHVAVGPDLSAEGQRVREEWLRAYLAAPVAIRPAGPRPGAGGQMPDFRLDAGEVEALVRFLMEQRAAELPAWTPGVLSPFSMGKAEVLLRDRWSCLGCHQLGDDGGRIGPRLDGAARRLRPEYVRALIDDPSHLAPGTIMPGSLEQPDRLDLIASYLLQREAPWAGSQRVAEIDLRAAGLLLAAETDLLAAGSLPATEFDLRAGSRPAAETGGAAGTPRVPSASPGVGASVYRARCAPCHGEDGDGDGFNAPYLPVAPTAHRDSAAISLRPDDVLYDGIYAGGRILGKSHRMPAFGASLSDAEIRAVVAYIRELCGCRGPAWSRDARAAGGSIGGRERATPCR